MGRRGILVGESDERIAPAGGLSGSSAPAEACEGESDVGEVRRDEEKPAVPATPLAADDEAAPYSESDESDALKYKGCEYPPIASSPSDLSAKNLRFAYLSLWTSPLSPRFFPSELSFFPPLFLPPLCEFCILLASLFFSEFANLTTKGNIDFGNFVLFKRAIASVALSRCENLTNPAPRPSPRFEGVMKTSTISPNSLNTLLSSCSVILVGKFPINNLNSVLACCESEMRTCNLPGPPGSVTF